MRAEDTRRITRLRGDDFDALWPDLLDVVLAAQRQVAPPGGLQGRAACANQTLRHLSVSHVCDGTQRHEEG
jgi:hypothetical protein